MSRYTSDGFDGSREGDFGESQLADRNANGYQIPEADYVWVLYTAELPLFTVLINTAAANSPEWFLNGLRRFRTRNVAIASHGLGNASWARSETQADVTLWPATDNADGIFPHSGNPGLGDVYLSNVSTNTNVSAFIMVVGDGTRVESETICQYDYEDPAGAWGQHYLESRADEYNIPAALAVLKDFLAAYSFANVWTDWPVRNVRNGGRYQCPQIYSSALAYWGSAGFVGTAFMEVNKNLADLLAVYSAYHADPIDGALKLQTGAYANINPFSGILVRLDADTPPNRACGIGRSTGHGITDGLSWSKMTLRARSKFNYVICERAIFNTTTPGRLDSMVRFVASGTLLIGDILTLPDPSRCDFPFISAAADGVRGAIGAIDVDIISADGFDEAILRYGRVHVVTDW